MSYVEIERHKERAEETAAENAEREEAGQAGEEKRLIHSRHDLCPSHSSRPGQSPHLHGSRGIRCNSQPKWVKRRRDLGTLANAHHIASMRQVSALTGSLCGCGLRRGRCFCRLPLLFADEFIPDRLGLLFGATERLVRASRLAVFRVRHVRHPSPQTGRRSSLREPSSAFVSAARLNPSTFIIGSRPGLVNRGFPGS